MKARIYYYSKRLVTRISFSPFRILAYALHATGLDNVYKPRFMRDTALLDIDDALVEKLPKYCHTISGAQGDPMNLVFVATERELKLAFRRAKWNRANPASPVHVAYGLAMALFKKSYKNGPFAPLYVNIALQDLAYQRPEKSDSFSHRHHLRIWRTGTILPDGKRVWVGAAGRESGMRLSFAAPFYTHALDPDIDKERSYVVKSLENTGATRLKSVQMRELILASNPHKTVFGSEYYSDGRAEVVQL